MFTTFQVFVCLKIAFISTFFFFFLKRISFHFALPSAGLRAEVARRWWLSPWWRDPPWAWFSLVTSTDRYRDVCTHTHWGTAAIQRSFSHSALISGRLLSLTHCCAERCFNGLTWWGLENASENLRLSRRARWWQWRGHGSRRHSAPCLSTAETSSEQLCLFLMRVETYFEHKMFRGWIIYCVWWDLFFFDIPLTLMCLIYCTVAILAILDTKTW